MKSYLQSCKTEFWHRVFEAETQWLSRQLDGAHKVLSVGCGPAMIEAALSERGFEVVGLDVSAETLQCAPDSIRTVVGSAEAMDFVDCCFDAVVFVVSLQFIEDYHEAIRESRRVLAADGMLVVMLLNPKSEFFQSKMRDPDSYVQRIKHLDLRAIESAIRDGFCIRTEYILGIRSGRVFETSCPDWASLYVITGRKKERGHCRERLT
jgi:SAM-dependent methyltransferase